LQLFATFSIFACNFLLQFLSSIAQNASVIKKMLQDYFSLVLFALIAWKRPIWRISCVSMLSMTKQLVSKLEVLQPQPSTTLPEVEERKILAFVQVRANENRLGQVFRSQMYR